MVEYIRQHKDVYLVYLVMILILGAIVLSKNYEMMYAILILSLIVLVATWLSKLYKNENLVYYSVDNTKKEITKREYDKNVKSKG